MQDKSTKFLIDTNLFIAAVKHGETKSTELLLKLLEGPWDLIADDILLAEYERYAGQFDAEDLLALLKKRMIVIEQSEQEIRKCRQYFSSDAAADIIHAAACLHAGAILISNDTHFKDIDKAGVIEVWTIAEAIEKFLD